MGKETDQALKVIFSYFRTMGTCLVFLALLFNAMDTTLLRVKYEVLELGSWQRNTNKNVNDLFRLCCFGQVLML